MEQIPGAALISQRIIPVIVNAVRFRHAPHSSCAIVMICRQYLPAVFIRIECTALIDMALPCFQRGFNHPNPMKFVAKIVWIQVARFDHRINVSAFLMCFVRVIRNDELLFTYELPIITIHSSVKHIGHIVCAQSIRRGTGIVIANVGCLANSALTRVINPSLPLGYCLI